MDPNQPYSPMPEPRENKLVYFLKAGAFEVVFVGVMIAIILGTLNYFHVISLKGLLEKLTTSQTATSTSQPQIRFNSTDSPHERLAHFMEEIFLPEYVPPLEKISQRTIISQVNWQTGSSSFSATLLNSTNDNPTQLPDIAVNTRSKTITANVLDITSAHTISQRFFTNSASFSWNCYPYFQDKIICREVFKLDSGNLIYEIFQEAKAAYSLNVCYFQKAVSLTPKEKCLPM